MTGGSATGGEPSRASGRSVDVPPSAVPLTTTTLRSAEGLELLRRLVANRTTQAVAAVLAIAWLSWPVQTLVPGTGLDPSWQAALSMASRQSLDVGEDIVVPYGPLGFLTAPYLYYPLTAALAGLYVGALHVFTVGSLFLVARRTFGFVGAAVIAWAIAKAAIGLLTTSLLLPALAFLWCAHAIRLRSERWFIAIAVVSGSVGALELLVRLNVGVSVLAIGGLTLVMRSQNRLRNLALFLASAILSLLTFWLIAGQELGALPEYFSYSYEIVSGYSDAMGFEDLARRWEYVAAALVAAVAVFIGWRNTDDLARLERLKLLALGAILAYPTFKQGFVRHDLFHSDVWFITAAVVVTSLAWRRARRVETALGLTCVLVALIASAQLKPSELDPIRSADAAVDQLRTIAGSDRLAVAAQVRLNMRGLYGIDEHMLELARGRTVHILPHETSVAWAYPELRWRPLPVFQSYLAYTPTLDKLDADALESAGPDFILRSLDAPIDGRHTTFEAPKTVLAMFCRYREVATHPFWELLARGRDRCGTPRLIESRRVAIGEEFAVPAGTGRGVVLADLSELPTSLWQRVRSLLLRRENLYLTVNQAGTFRLVPPTARGGLIVRVPDRLDYSGDFALSVDATSLRLAEGDGDQSAHADEKFTVDFYEVPIEAEPRS